MKYLFETMKYHKTIIGSSEYFLLDLDQKVVEKRVIEDMESGVDVYYDRRWEITSHLTNWLEANHSVFQEKNVLVLGAGIGEETLVLGSRAKKIFLNDLSSTALELCVAQLQKNEIKNYEVLLGRYEQLELPSVDLVVASFLVYNSETLKAIRVFIKEMNCRFLLMNENLKEFQKLLVEFEHEIVFEVEGAKCVMLG